MVSSAVVIVLRLVVPVGVLQTLARIQLVLS